MHIERIRVLNYKSFRDSGFIEFRPGFNVIVGQNNAGKTALLEALGLHLGENKPHRRRDLQEGYPTDPTSSFEFDLVVKGEELLDSVARTQGLPELERLEAIRLQYPTPEIKGEASVCSNLITNRGGSWSPRPMGQTVPSITLTACGKFLSQHLVTGETAAFINFFDQTGSHISQLLWAGLSSRIYAFKAERMNVNRYSFGEDRSLQPNAANLPTVLANLFSNEPYRSQQFNEAVSQILPSIQLVQSPNIGGQHHIRIKNVGVSLDRSDLNHGLEDCGAGVGQVLSILYVAMTMPPSVIIIDEPNSFLHPGAAKKLLQILASYPHQYIISTHSTDIIASVAPATLHLVQWADGESKVIPLNIEDLDDLRLVLSEVGIGLSDMFAADRVVWVEGKTEELCFPLLVKARLGSMPIGTSFLGLRNTGEFDGKKAPAEQVLDLYKKLGNANGIMPHALAFSLDREDRSPAKRLDLQRQYKNQLHFLPRRCYENYLLDAHAIADVLSSDMAEGVFISVDAVKAFLADKVNVDTTGNFAAETDAAKLLARLFFDLSAATVAFNKVRHSVELTKWLLENNSGVLEELTDYVLALMEPDAAAGI